MIERDKENIICDEFIANDENQAFINDLKHFGYLLPTNDEELEEFNKIFGTTKIMLPEDLKNPSFPLKNNSHRNTGMKPVQKADTPKGSKKKAVTTPVRAITANDYFKKLVLAAEIATQLHNDYFFGHIKFVKVQYLCDEICNMELNTNYGKYVAGPFDPKLMHSIDAEFKRRKWFTVTKASYGFKYKPGLNALDYKKYYSRYFSSSSDKIDYIIDLFKNKKADFCEVVATLFAVWKEAVNKNVIITDAVLIKAFYEWNASKKRFKELELINAIIWMNDNNIVPMMIDKLQGDDK